MTWQTPLLKSQKLDASARVVGNPALVCTYFYTPYMQYVPVVGNSCTRYLLNQRWVNLNSFSWGMIKKKLFKKLSLSLSSKLLPTIKSALHVVYTSAPYNGVNLEERPLKGLPSWHFLYRVGGWGCSTDRLSSRPHPAQDSTAARLRAHLQCDWGNLWSDQTCDVSNSN